MKILITGGAGYIGSALAVELAKHKSIKEIIVYDILARNNYGLFSEPLPSNKLRFVKGNILDNHSLRNALKGCDVVYHLAAKVVSPDSDNDSAYFEQVNNWGTSTLINEVNKSSVKRFIYTSSVYVYGQDSEVKTTNDTPLPNSFYGISKLRGEEHMRSLKPDINSYIVRVGSVYGLSPATRFDVFINKLVFEAQFMNKVAIFGEGNQIRPFIHVDKVATSLSKYLDSNISNGTYNLVEHNASVNDILDELRNHYQDLEFNYVNRHIRMKDIIVEPSKEIKELVGYNEKTFNEEIKELKNLFWK